MNPSSPGTDVERIVVSRKMRHSLPKIPLGRSLLLFYCLNYLMCLRSEPALASFADSPSCSPFVCRCVSEQLLVDCSDRGFPFPPSSLPRDTETLSLSRNELININATELSNLSDLKQLDLSNNMLSEIAFKLHKNLQIIDLSSNNISSVRSLHLKGLVSLKELNLADNKIISIPARSFRGLGMLRTLNLKSNRLVSLEAGCLDRLPSLRELILSKNRLSSFPKGLFKSLSQLEVLELNKNKFIEIQGLTFHGLTNLKILRLRRNDIEYLMDGAFYGLDSIEELILDKNKVNAVQKGWLYGLYTLKKLSLEENNVEYITEDGWEFCRNLEKIDLRANKLQLLDRDSLRMLPQLRHLNLQDNMISHIQDDETFAEVPKLETLNLDGNLISHTVEDMDSPFKGLANLKKLSMSRNQIKSIGKRAFYGLLDLKVLDVTENVISTIEENPFSRLLNLTEIKLNSSSLLCDCYLKWYPLYLNTSNIMGSEEATCTHPESLKGQSVMKIAYESFTCDDYPKPYILKQPKTQNTLKEDNLTMTCHAASTSTADMSFEWKLEGKALKYPPCDSSFPNSPFQERCIKTIDNSFDGKGRDIVSQLHLHNLTYSDAGRYQCIIANSFGATYSDKANITVYVYPQFVITPEDITVSGGSTAELKCGARGVPAPKVSWSKSSGSDFPAAKERRILKKDFSDDSDKYTKINSFVISNVKAKDMGNYQCNASNPAGSISWNITLSVLEVPRFVKPMENKTVRAGETAVIECLASGSPKPRLTWTKDSVQLNGTQERHFFTADNQLLIIVKTRSEDAGIYKCTMHNPLGTESQLSELKIEESGGGFGLLGDSSKSGGMSNQTITIIVVAVIVCVTLTSLVWVCVVVKAKRQYHRTQYRQSTAMANNPHHPSQNKSLFPSGRGGRSSESEIVHSEEFFDIESHVRRGLMPEKEKYKSHTHVNQETGLITTELKNKHHHNANTKSIENGERDSGTGDSKKSSDITTEEELLSCDNAANSHSEALALLGDDGAGECKISLSECDFAYPLEDSASEEDDETHSIPSSDQGGGEALDIDCNLLAEENSFSESVHSDENVSAEEVASSQVNDGDVLAFRTFNPSGQKETNQSNDAQFQTVKESPVLESNGTCYLTIKDGSQKPVRSLSKTHLEETAYRGGGIGAHHDNDLEYQQELLEASLSSTHRSAPEHQSMGRSKTLQSFFRDRRRRMSLSRGSKKHLNNIARDEAKNDEDRRSSVVFKDANMFS